MSENPNKKRKTNDGRSQVSDPRFANIHSDPRYRLPSKKQKVKLDKRFQKAFQGDAFVKRAKVDRYGRPVKDDAARRRLEQKFEIASDEESDEIDDDDEVQQELARAQQKHDPLRDGKLDVSSSEESSSEDESEVEVEHEESEHETEVNIPEGKVSHRIALVNLDWDNIRAEDLMAVFSSFLPTGGHLSQVAVYPSEFGKERMDREEMEGPPKEIFAQKNNGLHQDSTDEEDELDDEDIKASVIKPDDGSEFDSQALRQYQLERLRYFYAVLTFSTKAAAKHIYDAVDGTEYLSTANFFDLRFVPEEMDFDGDKTRDVCTTLPSDYKPNEFVTDALQHSKVKLTWDQEDRGRKDAQARAFKGSRKEIDENDLKAYLGSDSSDNDSEPEVEMADMSIASTKSKKQSEREKARALLGFSTEPAKSSKFKIQDGPVGDVQITFSSGLSGATEANEQKRSVFENSPEPNETTAEKYIRKEKERKQKRKEKMKAARAGQTGDEDTETFQEEEEGADLGFDDPFFDESALNDQSSKNKTRKEDRLKKKQEKEAQEAASAKQRAELELIMAEDAEAQSALAGKGRAVQHFDMTEIEKAEKRKGKKEKYKKKYKTDKTVLQDDFEMDVADPRLGKLFENHEFAIDPTNQRLKQTAGMKELIQESRNRKRNQAHGPREVKSVKEPATSNDTVDLVAKIKRRAQ